MSKKIYFFICFSLVFILCGCNKVNDVEEENIKSNTSLSLKSSNSSTTRLSASKKESELLAEFTTTIYDTSDDRETNMTIACNTLSGTVVKAGETFSFCDTLGPAKPEDGYKKADVLDADGEIIQEYGGGKCQISTTLYNVVLQIPNLVVVERHPHSKEVAYIETGKDAAVSYGSIDFKFRNDNPYDIVIDAVNNLDTIYVKISKI